MNIDNMRFLNECCDTTGYGSVLMEDSAQELAVQNAIAKILEATVTKYKKVNFTEVEKTHGDITKLKYYKQLKESIDTLVSIHETTKKLPDALVLRRTLNNLINLRGNFEKSFRVRNELAIMIYNLIIYALMESTSYCISTSISFVSPDSQEIIITTDKPSALVVQLEKFNKSAENGSVLKVLSETNDGVVTEAIVVDLGSKALAWAKGLSGIGKIVLGTVAVAALVGGLLFGIRYFAYVLYETKHNISQAAAQQAMFLQLNIETLQNNNGDPTVIAKQKKWVDRFMKISKKYALECDTGIHNVEKEIHSNKIDVGDLII